MVSGDGTSNVPDKLEAHGFMNYHRNHMPSFAKVSAKLFTLAHAKVFIWTRQLQACFDNCKI